MTDPLELSAPDTFIPGTLGPPGKRVFYLQARQGSTLLSLRLEKQQVAGLAAYLGELLSELPATGDVGALPEVLVEPFEVDWLVGSIEVGYRDDEDRIVVALVELVPMPMEGADDADDADEADALDAAALEAARRAAVRLTRAQAVHFVAVAAQLVSAGRPPCPLCGKPVDPDGHACIKSNGHGHG